MLYARHLASSFSVPLKVFVPFPTYFDNMSYRQFAFQTEGLKEVESSLRKLHIPFTVEVGDPTSTVPEYASSQNAIAVVTDHLPLRTVRSWNHGIASELDRSKIPLFQVDAANVVSHVMLLFVCASFNFTQSF